VPRFAATPATVGPLTVVGGATAELLAGLGYDATEIGALRSAGVIA
jgi:crotonobetainyl-CoA:carnitine CoA-transferase CaiB-like acyl-CoA transferase